jgi:hypothetical protein
MARYTLLLISILLLILLSPLFTGDFLGLVLLSATASVVLLTGVYVISAHRGLFILAVVLAGGAFSTTIATLFTSNASIAFAANGLKAVFLLLMAGVVLRDVIRDETVTLDMIRGAVCCYLLIGLGWAFLYPMVEFIHPGAFTGLSETADGALAVDPPMIYYSFVTLTTLGYGDMAPVSSMARTLAWMEAVFGQLFIAVIIARLVGLEIAHRLRK